MTDNQRVSHHVGSQSTLQGVSHGLFSLLNHKAAQVRKVTTDCRRLQCFLDRSDVRDSSGREQTPKCTHAHVFQEVHVRSADTDSLHLDPDIAWRHFVSHRQLFKAQILCAVQHSCGIAPLGDSICKCRCAAEIPPAAARQGKPGRRECRQHCRTDRYTT